MITNGMVGRKKFNFSEIKMNIDVGLGQSRTPAERANSSVKQEAPSVGGGVVHRKK